MVFQHDAHSHGRSKRSTQMVILIAIHQDAGAYTPVCPFFLRTILL